MKVSNKRLERISFTTDANLYQLINRAVSSNKINRSLFIRSAIYDYILTNHSNLIVDEVNA
jgi:metal-responsive CopG/Arc/MetJ family transcriptional regulator